MSVDKIISKIAFPVLIAAGFILVFSFINTTTEATKQRQLDGQTYARFIACSLSFPPGTRTNDDIDFCWKTAMQDTGKTVKRYDNLNR